MVELTYEYDIRVVSYQVCSDVVKQDLCLRTKNLTNVILQYVCVCVERV
jgi:hypothetical protein